MPEINNPESEIIVKVNDRSSGKRTRSKTKTPDKPESPRRNDPYILGIYALLLIISVIELFSASSTEVSATNIYGPLVRHCIFLGLGFAIVMAFMNTHYYVFRKLAPFLAILSLLLLAFSTFKGVEINGAQRAIKIGTFTLQPPEIVKLTVIILLSDILAKNLIRGDVNNKGVTLAAIVVLIFGGLLYSNGLTNLILLMGASLCMFLLSGMKTKKIGIVVLIYAVCGGAMLMIKSSSKSSDEFDNIGKADTAYEMVQKDELDNNISLGRRGDTWVGRIKRHLKGVHPGDTIDDMNRQVIFAKFALARGGVVGNGPGNSRESSRLPLAFSDYIYSIVVEDTGLVGGVALIILYLCLLLRAGRIASKCSRPFPALLIMGCAILIVFQALVHMAIVTGVFPVSGQPLPLISKGGTSILVTSIAFGIMLSVSRFAVRTGSKKQIIREEINALPEELSSENPTQL